MQARVAALSRTESLYHHQFLDPHTATPQELKLIAAFLSVFLGSSRKKAPRNSEFGWAKFAPSERKWAERGFLPNLGGTWETENIHRLAAVRNFSLPKKWGHRGKISVVDMAFLIFIGLLHLPPAWKVFFEARKVLQMIFFPWWSCMLFSSLGRAGGSSLAAFVITTRPDGLPKAEEPGRPSKEMKRTGAANAK